jgi:hypothetical protein
MITSAKLYIAGHSTEKKGGIQISSCSFGFSQGIDATKKPNTIVNGGIIDMTFDSLGDADIIQWMVSRDADKSGKIVFSEDPNSKPFQVLQFRDARLVSFHQSFGGMSLIVSITLSARAMNLDGVVFKNRWIGYDKKEDNDRWD